MVKSIYLMDGIYAVFDIKGFPKLSRKDLEYFEKVSLDKLIETIIKRKPTSHKMLSTIDDKIYYTPGVESIIFSNQKDVINKYANTNTAQINANLIYTRLVGRITESRLYLAEAKKIIKTHKIKNPKRPFGE